MSDVEAYIRDRKRRDPEFAEDFEVGYEQFKIGVFLRNMREQANLTQEELARKMNTRKSAISRIENHAENINVVTLQRYAAALGKRLHVSIT
jgi:HTH-type transcriptional regulator / antitoxin HipB